MKKLMLATAVFALLAPVAHAKNVQLVGDRADSFISRHFPDAEIPGEVEGVFEYMNKAGLKKRGYAQCFVPAMGGRSDGYVSTCDVIY